MHKSLPTLILASTIWIFSACASDGVQPAGQPEELEITEPTISDDAEPTSPDPDTTDADAIPDGSDDTGSIVEGGRCEGNYLLSNAEELSLISNCREITGSLTFNGILFETLSLPDLVHIGESLFIHETQGLVNLEGFSGLESVGKHLKITKCAGLESFDGLDNLQTIGDELYIAGNPDLVEIDALRLITEIPGRIMRISSNPKLENIRGFESITQVGGTLKIWDNDILTDLEGLNNLQSLGESSDDYRDLDVSYNPQLINVDALANVATVLGSLILLDNRSLLSIEGLNNISEVGQDLNLSDNTALPTCEAEELLSQIETGSGIGGEITIEGNNDGSDCDP